MKELQLFNENISRIQRPKAFTFPFYYTPHKLSEIAVEQLQNELEQTLHIEHNFGLTESDSRPVIGKMFGILVVECEDKSLGFLKSYSGKLSGNNEELKYFVPPIQNEEDLLKIENKSKIKVESINQSILQLEKRLASLDLIEVEEKIKTKKDEIEQFRNKALKAKKKRKQKRTSSQLGQEELLKLAQESISQKKHLLLLKNELKALEQDFGKEVSPLLDQINNYKETRKEILKSLQKEIQNQFIFVNGQQEQKNLFEIFKDENNKMPNSGSGECCAPKLLNFAFKNNLKPVAMAEFWWGAPPKNAIRRHKYYYPACTGRCGPILKFMLKGIQLEENPMVKIQKDLSFKIFYEDNDLVIIDKPSGLLTTPGKTIKDSLQSRVQKLYPKLEHVMAIHRLDQGTSGLVIFAKNKFIHAKIQFLLNQKKIKKTYEAILDGHVGQKTGTINLSLGLDYNNPPFHMVNNAGKKAETKYKVLDSSKKNTLIQFEPITGRTHQLRIHSAHFLGLNAPIKGDDMYGLKSNRMYLHAARLEFTHPLTKEIINIYSPSKFFLES